jgi:predicted PurR-regulated permease PerM
MVNIPIQKKSKNDTHTDRNFFTERVLITAGIGSLIIILILILWKVIDVLLLIFASALMAIFLRGLSSLVSKYTHLRNSLSLVIVLFSLFGIFSIAIWLTAPKITEQVDQLMQTVPESVEQFREKLMEYEWIRTFLEGIPDFEDIIKLLARVGGFFSTTFGFLVSLFIILIVGLFLSINPQSYIQGLVKLVPQKKRGRAQEILHTLERTLFWWLVGRTVSMSIVAILTGIGLSLLDIPVAMALGVIAGLSSFVPNIGPIIASIPAILLALTKSPMHALYVIFLYLAVQNLESYLITPYITYRTVLMPLALVIIGQVLMGVLLGFLGLVFATPLVATLIVLVKLLYIEDVLGDTS